MNKNLRIACYGFVSKGGGSIIGANFLILEELLKREVQIDFYGRKNYIYPQELCKYQNFNYFDVKPSLIQVFSELLPSSFKKIIMPIINLSLAHKPSTQLFQQAVVANHQVNKYDLLLSLGYHSGFRIKNVPVISWLQGPPQSSWYFIQKLSKKIISLCGIGLYIKLKVFYALKAKQAKSEFGFSDVFICGSQWSKDWLISYGIKPKKIEILPYSVDLNFFKLNSSRPNKKQSDSKVFLWLGRSEPRKRLDLLLEAHTLLLQERQDVQLKIFGGFIWAQGYKKLIDHFEFPQYLEYKPSIDRAKVPELMEQCDVLIQSSEGENFETSVAEALCCGLPVIVGPTNGTKDFISPSSFVFEEYTAESLKKTMFQAIEAIEQKREKLALDARETAENNFSVYKIVDSLENIFQEAIELEQQSTENSDTKHAKQEKEGIKIHFNEKIGKF
jgi:glycosyltransferase involved in cell wall biosynthesis